MSFDSHSLERLRELGRKLPESLPKPNNNSKSNQEIKSNLHPIETEENPQKLFEELIKASPDGTIPPHLIERLRKAESLEFKKSIHSNNNISSENIKKSNSNSQKSPKSIKQKDDLYIAFEQLLLEEDSDN